MSAGGIRFGMIADDLTGACDAGVAFALAGFTTIVRLSESEAEPAEAIVIPTNSRNDPPEMARRKVERACRAFIEDGGEIVYKKIDSTLYGNVAVEIAAVQRSDSAATAREPCMPKA